MAKLNCILVIYLLNLIEFRAVGQNCKTLGLENKNKFPDSVFSIYPTQTSQLTFLRFNEEGYPLQESYRVRITLGRFIFNL